MDMRSWNDRRLQKIGMNQDFAIWRFMGDILVSDLDNLFNETALAWEFDKSTTGKEQLGRFITAKLGSHVRWGFTKRQPCAMLIYNTEQH